MPWPLFPAEKRAWSLYFGQPPLRGCFVPAGAEGAPAGSFFPFARGALHPTSVKSNLLHERDEVADRELHDRFWSDQYQISGRLDLGSGRT